MFPHFYLVGINSNQDEIDQIKGYNGYFDVEDVRS